MANSTQRSKKTKPEKPRKDFPLFAHHNGSWAKKVRGKLHYFGGWEHPDDALNKWLDQKDELLAGRKPRSQAGSDSISVEDAMNHYCEFILQRVEKGSRSRQWFEDVRSTCRIIKATIGPNWSAESLTTDDFDQLRGRFEITKTGRDASPVSTRGHILRTRGVFNWLVKAGYIETAPRYGIGFDVPSNSEINNHRDDQQTKLFTRSQVRALLRVTKGTMDNDRRMHAAIMLAINTGCQNKDIQTLKFKHVEFKAGWYIQPRTKKGKNRRAKLWPRTIKALDRMIGDRKRNPDDLVFLSKTFEEWHGRNCIAKEFKTVKELAGINIDGSGLQWLRHTFITHANETGDRDAVKIAVGHATRDITENYIHSVYDPRQIKIAKHVEDWLTAKRGAK